MPALIIQILTGLMLAYHPWHIVPVTILSILFVFVGVSFRTGWLY